MENSPKTLTDTQINTLAAEPAPVADLTEVQEAQAKLAQEEKEARINRLRTLIGKARRATIQAVEHLRDVRKQERKAKAQLVKMDLAEKTLLATGDLRAYAKVLYPNDETQQKYFVDMNSY